MCVALLTLICIGLCYWMGNRREHSRLCTGLNVVIADSAENSFVSKKEISNWLEKKYGKIKGVYTDSLNLVEIETIAEKMSAVYNTEAYTTMDGKLNLKITQRKAIVRFQKGKNGFYADEEGVMFPLQQSFAADVPIVEGALPISVSEGFKGKLKDSQQNKWLMQIIALVNCFNGDEKWKGALSQIHINEHKDLEIITLRGDEKFLFGQPVAVEDKKAKMEQYYKMILPSRSKAYEVVDLRFDGKIIGR